MKRSAAQVLVLSLVAAMLSLLPVAVTAQQTTQDFPLRPADGIATKGGVGDLVTVEAPTQIGQAEPRLPETGAIATATFVGIEADGDRVRQSISQTVLNQTNTSRTEYLFNDGGVLRGRVRMTCIYSLPENPCQVPHEAVQTAYMEVTFEGGARVYASTTMGVDYIQPSLLEYIHVEPDIIRVVFTEPVRMINRITGGEADDSPEDWEVTDSRASVIAVDRDEDDCRAFGFPAGTSGCTRILTLDQELPGDSRPRMDYVPLVLGQADPTRDVYEDYARQTVFDFAGESRAVDRIRPAIPTITSLINNAGTGRIPAATGGSSACPAAPDFRVLSNSLTPTLRITNIAAGHDYLISANGQVVIEETAAPQARPFDVRLPRGLVEGLNRISVVALDPEVPAQGRNRSDDADKSTDGDDGDGNPLCYTADVTPPLPGAAVRVPNQTRSIAVGFLEDLVQAAAADDNPLTADPDPNVGVWVIDPGGPAEQTANQVVRGSSSRQLIISFPNPISAAVTRIAWRGTDGDRYLDAAGNVMVDFTRDLVPLPLPLRPVFVTPSATTPRFVNVAAYTPRGTLNPDQKTGEVSRIVLGATSAEGGVPSPEPVSVQGESRTWQGRYTFPRDGVYRFTAAAENQFGDRSGIATSEVVEFDGTKPVVTIVDPEPPSGPLGLPGGQPQDYPAGETVDVRLNVTDKNYRSVTVVVDYEGSGGNAEDDAPASTVVTVAGGEAGDNGLGQNFTVPFTPPEVALGEATITVTADDLAGNVSEIAQTRINLTDAITGPIRTDLVSNVAGDVRIEVEFGIGLTGSTFPADWSADDGIEDGRSSRRPLRAVPTGRVVTLTFGQPFPGLVAADRNAAPFVDYTASVASTLEATDGRAVFVRHRLARDLDFPQPPQVLPTEVGPIRLAGQPPQGVSCATSPAPPECPFTYTFSGSTHESLRPNRYTVRRVPNGPTAGTAPGQVVRSGMATTQGAFSFTVEVSPNATSTFRVDLVDGNGNPTRNPDGTPGGPVLLSVTEDSLGPDVKQLFASLVDGDTLRIASTFLPADGATSVDLTYRLNGGPSTPIATAAVAADGTATHAWNLPEGINLATDSLLITAVGRDALGNLGVPLTTGLTDLPVLVSATALSLTQVVVTTDEPVTTPSVGSAGFAIAGGPGVRSTSVDAAGRLVLALNGELPTDTPLEVTYNGQGRWVAADGRPLRSGRVPLSIDLLLPVTGLVAGPGCERGVVLSFVDAGNGLGTVASYELSRGGQVIGTIAGSERIFFDPEAPVGDLTYSVVPIAADGRRAEAAVVRFTNGDTPVPGAQGRDAAFGGSGFPADAPVVAEGRFTSTPNLGPAGGVALSCDGRVALLVPPGASLTPAFAKIARRQDPTVTGYTSLTDLYQVTAVAADTYATLDSLAGYAELNVRDLRSELAAGQPALVTSIRVGDGLLEEQAPRVGVETLATQLLTYGSLQTVQANGRTIRVFGPDPAIASDRFATAVGLSQTQHRRAAEVVLARADDYPDALSAAPLAAMIGGPVLLTRTGSVPETTVLELRRLEATAVTIVGGPAAVSVDAEGQLTDLGFAVTRIGGETRYHTSALVAERIGSVDDTAFLATGLNFADALSASAPAASLGRPVLLTATSSLVPITTQTMLSLGIQQAHVVGGPAAIKPEVIAEVEGAGINTLRSFGESRYDTAVALASDLLAAGTLTGARPLIASGDGDGITSPDALAAGPVAGRFRSYLLLTPQGRLPDEIAAFLRGQQGIAGLIVAGGPVAVADDVRVLIDATG